MALYSFFSERKLTRAKKKTGFGENRVNMQLAGRMLWKCISYATSGMNKSHPRIRRKKQEKKKKATTATKTTKTTKKNKKQPSQLPVFGILEHRKPHKSGRCTGSQAQKPQSYFFFFVFSFCSLCPHQMMRLYLRCQCE